MRIRRHLSFANICSFLALTIALSTGTAYAANTIFSTDIVDGQVKAPDIGTGAVGTRALADGSVTGADVGDGWLTGDDLATGSVGGAQLTDRSVAAADLAAGAVGSGAVANNSLTGRDLAGGGAVGEVTVAAGYVPAERCRSVTVRVGGPALAGDVVVLSEQAPMQEGVFFYGAQVVSPTQVRALLCNLSGGPQAAVTGLPVRVLTLR
jgi:hypothetical protein